MKFSDVIALARAGYKKKDIDDLLNMDMREQEESEQYQEQPEQDQEESEQDYKTLYEQAQKDLQKAQAANRQQNINKDNEQDEQKVLSDIVNNFIY